MAGSVSLLFLVFACSGASATLASNRQATTPVESVVNLLEKLLQQTQQEGQDEAKAYDKYACFCKEQADGKLYAIDRANAKIALLTAEIKELTAAITVLNQDIAQMNREIESHKKTCTNEQAERDSEFAAYVKRREDLQAAVREADDGIELLKATKAPGLLQTTMTSILERAANLKASFEFAENPAGSVFHSDDIVQKIMDIKKMYNEFLNDNDTHEQQNHHTFAQAQAARFRQIHSLEANVASSQAEVATKETRKQLATDDKDQTVADRNADQAFLADLTNQCEDKAQSWDDRSNTRHKEIIAIANALQVLKAEVVGNYGANNKLVALFSQANTPGDVADVAQNSPLSVSFLERRLEPTNRKKRVALSTRQSKVLKAVSNEKLGMTKMISYLDEQAKKLKSDTLSALVMHMKEDHFVKVRGMIKDMIAKLQADASAEADQKTWCDDEMEKSMYKRDDYTGHVEGDSAVIAEATATVQRKEEEIQLLLQQVADLRKGLNEATELRSIEKAQNGKTVADATNGLAGVNRAIAILANFYNNALLQTGGSYTPPNADASGKTVGDYAPETFTGEFHGNQDAAQGITGQLQVIKTDFDRTITQTQADEDGAETIFNEYQADNDSSVYEKEDLMRQKRGEIVSEKSTLSDSKDDLKEHYALKAEALDELAKLQPACVSTGSTYIDRVRRREQEIDSLKNAYVILNEMR